MDEIASHIQTDPMINDINRKNKTKKYIQITKYIFMGRFVAREKYSIQQQPE